jgi:hypothetical protein
VVTGRDGSPLGGAQVRLLPPINLREDQTAYRSGIADSQGRFAISAIHPEAYTVLAFPQPVETSDLMNREFIAPYLNFGVPVDLPKGQAIRQRDLTVIRP